MSLNEEVDLLRNIPLFSKIESSKLKLLAFASERVIFGAGQELFHQGDHADTAYIIIQGAADVAVDTPGGEMVVARLEKNDIVGEIGILCDVPRTATVRAVDPVTALAISRDLFLKMISEYPQMAIEIMRELAHRLESTTAQLLKARNR